MNFKLFYKDQLRGNGKPEDKQRIRRSFAPQLKFLWSQNSLKDFSKHVNLEPGTTNSLIHQVGGFNCLPLAQKSLELVVKLDITLLRPEEPGNIITQGGDIDGRLKTLLDSLQMPKLEQIPSGNKPSEEEDPFYCLYEDDNLVTTLSVITDRLLEPPGHQHDVILLINVTTEFTHQHFTNIISVPNVSNNAK